ncbi:MAG: 1,4-dihydroxy-2-naphthoate octaprenyltransferase [Candidatus Eisenbacteria sp.]|nr:1,4-dihydroxy-2-naphthoate octaprenyltransferase [Candidatus Eisenbacteria bacterium]
MEEATRIYDAGQSRVRSWLAELRAPFLTGSITPVVLGSIVAWRETGAFHWSCFILATLGAAFLHLGANIANDYFDHRSGNDEANTRFIRPFSGGSRLIQEGLLPARQVLAAAVLFYIAALAIGIYLTWVVGPGIIAFGLIGLLGGYFYTAPPFKLGYRGFGEIIIGINFGVLCVLGGYYVQTQGLSWEAFVISLPMAFLIMAVLWINQFPDFDADNQVGKHHWVIRLGRKKSVSVYGGLLIGAYVVIGFGLVSRLVPMWAALGLATLPLSIKALRTARAYHDDPMKLVPANAGTIVIHLATGLLLSAGYVLSRLI